MAQSRISARDFLTGRDRAIRQYDAPFQEALASDDKARVVSLCKSLTIEYHQQCRLFKSTFKNRINMNIASSITPFVNAILKFLQNLKSPMGKEEASMILVAARFLRLCCAGREVYSKRCVESRDKGHAFAENLLGKALIGLNKKRDEAIKVASQKPKKKKTSGKKKAAPGLKSQNFFHTLLDSIDDVVAKLNEFDEGHQEDAKEEENQKVEIFPVVREQSDEDASSNLTQAQILDLFLNTKVSENRDLVHHFMQADHLGSIEDTIWGNDPERNFVHLKSFEYMPIPTELVGDLVQLLPSNRLVLYNIGRVFVAASKDFDGGVHHDQLRNYILEHLKKVVTFLQGLGPEALELVHAIPFVYEMAGSDMERNMRYLKIINKVNPLFISIMGMDAHLYRNFFDFIGLTPILQTKLHFAATCAFLFEEENKHTLTEIISDRATFKQDEFLDKVLATKFTDGSYDRISYTPSFMLILDRRFEELKQIHLPMELLNDDDDVTVDIKIHDVKVDAYFKEVTQFNEGHCHIFIPSVHMTTIDATENKHILQCKSVKEVTHADGEKQILQIIDPPLWRW